MLCCYAKQIKILTSWMQPSLPPGRKIHPDFENPIDDVLIRFAGYISPALKATGHTPNVLTVYSMLFGLGSIWALWHGKKVAFAALYFASYFFDCVDGDFARRYNMVTRLGDALDHISDIILYLGVSVVMWLKYEWPTYMLVPWAISMTLLLSHAGCQQKAYKLIKPRDDPPESLDLTQHMCLQPDDPHAAMRLTRWFGFGTAQLLFVLIVLCARRK